MENTTSDPSSVAAQKFDPGSLPEGYTPFDPVAGRCSAAHAEWLRRLRDRNLYKSRSSDWDDFCRNNVGMSGEHATRIIDLLEEFGANYFKLSELTHITPEEFRAVASKLKGNYLCVNGRAIELLPENAPRIAVAMEKLRRPRPGRTRTWRPPSTNNRVTLLEKSCREVAQEFRKLAKPKASDVDRLQLASVLRKTLSLLGRIEMELGIY